jgi:hypothetical protein
MSGIAKPHISFNGALPAAAADKMYPVEDIQSIEKQDIAAFGTGRPAEYRILLTYKNGTSESIKFTSSSVRNTSLTNAKTIMAAAVASV